MCGHYADFSSFFFSSFKTLEEYFLSRSLFLQDGQSSATNAAHFYAAARVVKEQKSGNQVNYGWWLADKSERKLAGESRSTRRREQGSSFCHIIPMNTAGSVQQAWPDLTACFVRSVVTLLTRFVLTQTSPSSAT